MRLPALAALALIAAFPAAAHHSFAVYFDPDAEVSLQGTVTAFRFTNPHGILVLDVAGEQWRAETNAPVVLRRRGWTRTSLRPGQQVSVSGWRSRDGRNFMRLREVRDDQGNLVGTAPFGQHDD